MGEPYLFLITIRIQRGMRHNMMQKPGNKPELPGRKPNALLTDTPRLPFKGAVMQSSRCRDTRK